jgi:hypothetical protein
MEQGTWSPALMIINTLIEFNMGIVIMFLIWFPLKVKRDGQGIPWLRWRDLRKIKTDFNSIATIVSNESKSRKRREFLETHYPIAAIDADIQYYKDLYTK